MCRKPFFYAETVVLFGFMTGFQRIMDNEGSRQETTRNELHRYTFR